MRRLRKLRESRGLSQAQVAKTLGVSAKTYARYEGDTMDIPVTEDLIYLVRQVYGTSFDYVAELTDVMEPYL